MKATMLGASLGNRLEVVEFMILMRLVIPLLQINSESIGTLEHNSLKG